MASQPSSNQKTSSRWGSFLANVESKLDTILADEETLSKLALQEDGKVQEQPGKKEGMALPVGAAPGQTRTSSTNRAQDRLNEKLARAMANRNLGKKAESSAPTSEVPSRTASPANGVGSQRSSTEVNRERQVGDNPQQEHNNQVPPQNVVINGVDNDDKGNETNSNTAVGSPVILTTDNVQSEISIANKNIQDVSTASRTSFESRESGSARPSFEQKSPTSPNLLESSNTNYSGPTQATKSSEEYESLLSQLRSDNESAELRRQQEVHDYLERIDALQAKLQYLTKEAAETAKSAAGEAPLGSLEQKIAVKDERIALLIEEGQRLSQTELKHLSIIKKLRAKSSEDDKTVTEANKGMERQQRLAKEAQERAKRADALERQATEKAKTLVKIEKNLENTRIERDNSERLVRDLQLQLSEATSSAKEAEEKARAEALDQERRKAADLADELTNIKIEKELAEKGHQNELRELKAKSEREKERARVADIERQAEQDALESRLEAYRARAEEASASQGGDVQAKLLRQIETLQNQYAIASENWQGIEGSLLSRVATLEKERDDIAKGESDIRRKAREANTRLRRVEEDYERANAKVNDLESELFSRSTQISNLQQRLANTENEVAGARKGHKIEREAWDAQFATRLEEERIKVREDLLRSTPDLYQQSRTGSPARRTRKSSNADRVNPVPSRRPAQGLGIQSGQGLALVGNGHSPIERSLSRRSSEKRVFSNTSEYPPPPTPVRTDSMSTVPQLSFNNGIPETPVIIDSKEDDGYFDDVVTPATPDRTVNELFSVSTAAAGPSVQLVERMSAAVRRLESEKAAHKDELGRLISQRDEAREQIVDLMKDNDGKKASDQRVSGLEKELGEVQQRYLTTLEMLGEKSEKVEELKADVDDLKGMYRELVERTTR